MLGVLTVRAEEDAFETLAGLFAVASFSGFERSTSFGCILQELILAAYRRADLPRPRVGSWTSLDQNATRI